MNFAIDENIPVELIPWLNQLGHKTVLVAKGNSDEKVFSFAKGRKATLLTQDRHFANTLRFPPKGSFGIVRIKIHPAHIEDIIFSIESLFKVFNKPEDFKNKLVILNKEGFFKLKE